MNWRDEIRNEAAEGTKILEIKMFADKFKVKVERLVTARKN